MISAEAAEHPTSSSGSGCTQDNKQLQRAAAPDQPTRQASAAPPSPADKCEADSGRGKRGIGGGVGLTKEELHDLHKNDPKRAKRILANRSSAARSKVRKLRYIGELESKSASLQEEADRLFSELEDLNKSSLKLGQENEELFDQAYKIEDHMHSQAAETERLSQQLQSLRAMEIQFLQLRTLRSAPLPRHHHQAAVPPPFIDSPLPTAGSLQEFQGDQLPSLQVPRRHVFQQDMTPLPSFASVASMFANLPGHQPPLPATDSLPELKLDQPLQMAKLPGGSGRTISIQEPKLPPEMEPSLLELLTLNPDLDTTSAKPFLPPLRGFGLASQDAPGPALGLASGLPSVDSCRSKNDSAYGLAGLTASENAILDVGRHRSVSSAASSYSTFAAIRAKAPALLPGQLESFSDAVVGRQGLARWPRHFSDPQGFRGL